MIKHIIAIYPGRFQPFGKHHAAAFKWLQKEFGQANAYIVTSDKVDPPKSPFSFEDKKDIITQYGFDHVIQVKNPYKAEELMKDFDPEDTAVVFMVGEKDMQEDPRFKIGTKKDGSPSYFQIYKDNKSNLQGFDKHGYLITAPHVSINIPGYGEMSGTELRKVLGDKTISREEKSKVFKDIFGWYDAKIANNMMAKLEALNETVFSKNWWKSIFESIDEKTKNSITEENILTQIKSKFKVFLSKLKQENAETKKAFNLIIKAAKGDIKLTDTQKSEIGEQLKDTLKLAGLTAIAVAPGGIIVGALLKLLGQESLVTPSAFVNEVGEANLKPYKWEEIDRESYFIYTRFVTDSETQYDVDLKSTNYIDDNLKNLRTIEIEFSAKPKGAAGGSAKIVVNKGELYKVMATVADIVKKYIKTSKAQAIIYSPSKKSNEENFGTQRDNLYKAFISKAFPGTKFEKIGDLILATLPGAVTEGYMGAEQTKKHNAKLDKLKNFLNANIGREFVYDFDTFPKTVVGVGIQEGVTFIPSSSGKKLISDGGAAGHMAHPFNIDWVKNGKDLLEVFKMAVEYLKNGPGAVKIDGLNASVRLIELDGKKQFVLDRGSQKDLDIKGITKDDLLGRFGEGHGMIKVGGEVLDIFNAALNETKSELVKLGLWDNPNVMFNVEYVSGTSNVIDYGNNFLAIHGLLEIARQTNAKTGKPGARTTTEIDYNESIMQSYIDKLGAVAQTKGYEVVGSVPTEMKSEPNFAKVLSEKITINMGDKEETKPLSAWLSTIKVPENETIKLTDGKTVNALSKAVLNAVLAGTPMNEFVADPKDIPMAINGAITYLATAKLGDEVLKNLDSKLGVVSDHEGVVIRDEKIYDKPFKLTGQFIITGQTSQFQKNQ
jgi:hypothetical protein